MAEHPALRLAATTANAARELNSVMRPDDAGPVSGALTDADFTILLPRIESAVAMLSQCIELAGQAGDAAGRLGELMEAEQGGPHLDGRALEQLLDMLSPGQLGHYRAASARSARVLAPIRP